MPTRLVAICAAALLLACSSGPADPGLFYGPCIDNAYCGGEDQLKRVSIGQVGSGCICITRCNHDDECPVPAAAAARVFCATGDVVANGYAGICDLSCSADDDCPDGMTCLSGACRAPAP